MTVFIVFKLMDERCDDVWSVHATQESADKAISDYAMPESRYYVQEWAVDE